jgi:hypothetical protein
MLRAAISSGCDEAARENLRRILAWVGRLNFYLSSRQLQHSLRKPFFEIVPFDRMSFANDTPVNTCVSLRG